MLTYILGAGASYQSIPIVKTFPKRFSQFAEELNGLSTYSENNEISKKNFEEARNIAKILANEFENHQSFDTYFKKLFHTNEIVLIRKYKKLLNLYFIWEHVKNTEALLDENGDIIKGDDIFLKQSKVDKRYDALIAGLLQPIAGENKMFCKTNFITWNYDLNLISSIKNYFFSNETFMGMMEEIGFKNPVWNIKDQISVINMNGFFYSDVFNDAKDIYSLDAFELLKKRMTDSYFDDDCTANDAELIKFAWEKENNNGKLSAVLNMIEESKNIVVIGYTFPLYNRIIDSYLNNRFIGGKYLFFQDPNAENIMEDFVLYFDAKLNLRYMKPIINCNNFFVPKDIVR